MPALRASLASWMLCGLVYPIAVTGIGQMLTAIPSQRQPGGGPSGAVIVMRTIAFSPMTPKLPRLSAGIVQMEKLL